MGVPYETVEVGIEVNGGDTVVVPLRYPARGLVSKIIIQQTDGDQSQFTVELFNHQDLLEGTETSASDSGPQTEGGGGPVPWRLRRVCPPINSDTPGLLEYFTQTRIGSDGFPFVNQDPDTNRQGRKNGRLYVRIQTEGTDMKTFALAVGGESALD